MGLRSCDGVVVEWGVLWPGFVGKFLETAD